MRRSVKYGVYGAVLAAAVVGGTTAFAAADDHGKSITLVVDGKSSQLNTSAGTVGSALKDAGYKLTKHDIVAPAADSAVTNNETVVFKRGRLLHLTVDG